MFRATSSKHAPWHIIRSGGAALAAARQLLSIGWLRRPRRRKFDPDLGPLSCKITPLVFWQLHASGATRKGTAGSDGAL